MICDGMGDRAIPEFGNKTPLQKADTPNMDWLADKGMCGLMDAIAPGVIPGSDTAHLALLGYDPAEVYSGRGPFEAAGLDMELREGDVALRCNFATIQDGIITDRRAGRIKNPRALEECLDGMEIDGVKIIFKAAVEHRAVLILRGEGLSSSITDVDPHKPGSEPWVCKPVMPEGEKTAAVVNHFVKKSEKILGEHPLNKERENKGLLPANIVLPRGAGYMIPLTSLQDRYKITSSAIAGIGLVKGVCRLAGMDVPEVDGVTGGLDTNLDAKMNAVKDALKTHDFVLSNIKMPDIYGHDGDAAGKVNGIEKLDEALAPLKELIEEDVIIALTADHSTPVPVMNHSADPVPLLIAGKHVRRDEVVHFDEISVARGCIGRIKGMDLLPIMLDLANRSEKYGA